MKVSKLNFTQNHTSSRKAHLEHFVLSNILDNFTSNICKPKLVMRVTHFIDLSADRYRSDSACKKSNRHLDLNLKDLSTA